jgi:UDP-N-acetylglucosamine--N-acetylmuramyl-(pentapeptide) pyrophosphoryl-undecaprenol N-acetylglucosamine transferase
MVGRRGGPEERIVPEAGFDLETVAIQGLNRDALLSNIALPVVIPAALARGVAIVDSFRPDVVLGAGGYAMAPALFGARLRRVPYVLHEQNVLPGLATRLFARGAAAICTTFPGTRVKGAVELTGLPLRSGFEPRTPAVPPRTLLVTGGSQGALNINTTVWACLDDLLSRYPDVIHLTGRQGAEEARTHARPGYTAIAFTADMAGLLARADLVVSRAGVGTLAELTAVGLPSVLVPGTFGGGHQEHNAAALVDAGAALRLGDRELGPETFLATLDGLDPERLHALAAASAAMGRRDAASRVVAVLKRVAASR